MVLSSLKIFSFSFEPEKEDHCRIFHVFTIGSGIVSSYCSNNGHSSRTHATKSSAVSGSGNDGSNEIMLFGAPNILVQGPRAHPSPRPPTLCRHRHPDPGLPMSYALGLEFRFGNLVGESIHSSGCARVNHRKGYCIPSSLADQSDTPVNGSSEDDHQNKRENMFCLVAKNIVKLEKCDDKTLLRWFCSHSNGTKDILAGSSDASISTATFGDNNPTLTERNTSFHQSLNTDSRTCRDVITEYRYPYEAIPIVTSDGDVLLLEPILRRDARKVVFLPHGIMDSSIGWVSNRVVGSPAFAAFDKGFDVFLGNFSRFGFKRTCRQEYFLMASIGVTPSLNMGPRIYPHL
ncbi:hypothetical protein F0562_011484 [Nyssa sinensis]|uniref:Partial AB-hydrolase lipase domain-containing protein n=1 Tax=Nyssa sinensis TaxID=561372 RepID=A0A5J4ZUL4_9ASTE|nr:hypothetical protein F0562_011484 [Nyssa sinensis]